VTKTQVTEELGINANLLFRWCRNYALNGDAALPDQGKPREEMAALKRELARVKKERAFIKEAAVNHPGNPGDSFSRVRPPRPDPPVARRPSLRTPPVENRQ